MPALTADIALAIRGAQLEIWSDAAIKARYPNARDGKLQLAEGLFDSATDANAAVTARGALIGTERRRFKVVADELWWPSPNLGLPKAKIIDPENDVSRPGVVTRIELNLEAEQTLFEVMV